MIETSLIVATAAIGGNILLGVGLVATWQKNGRAASKKYGTLEERVAGVAEKQDTTIAKIDEIDKKVDCFQLHCADVSGRMDERLRTVERRKP